MASGAGRVKARPHGWLRWLLALALCCLPALARAEDPNHKQLLILHSYHQGYVWTSGIHEGLEKALREADVEADIRTEYLDWKHFPTPENLARQYAALLA